MKHINFKDQNIVYGENQKEYNPLPGLYFKDNKGPVITCWKLNFKERLKIIFSGKLWLQQLTFNAPLQPIKMDVYRKNIYTRPTDKMNRKQKKAYKKEQKEIEAEKLAKEKEIAKAVDKQKNYAKHLKVEKG